MEKITIYDSISLWDQIPKIIDILKNNSSYLIVVLNLETKIKLLKRLVFLGIIISDELSKAIELEREIAKYSDFIALSQDISLQNIIKVTNHPFIKTELKVDWDKILANNTIVKISDLPKIVQEATEKTKLSNDPISIWSMQTPVFGDISLQDLQTKYSTWKDDKINILIFNEVDESTYYKNIIILDANNAIYNNIVPHLAKTFESKLMFGKILAKTFVKADKIILFNNLSNNNISYLLLYFKGIKSVKKQNLPNQYAKPSFEGSGQLNSLTLNPKDLQKLLDNPLFFYFEFILKLKKIKTVPNKLPSFAIESLISDFITTNQIIEISSILDKYKFLNKLSKTIRLIKIENILNQKSIQPCQQINLNIEGIEISIRPNLTLFNNGNLENYYYTNSASSAINAGKDIAALIISNSVPIKSHFINYNKTTLITPNKSEFSQIKEIISYYKKNAAFSITNEYAGFSKSYQHLYRNLLIK